MKKSRFFLLLMIISLVTMVSCGGNQKVVAIKRAQHPVVTKKQFKVEAMTRATMESERFLDKISQVDFYVAGDGVTFSVKGEKYIDENTNEFIYPKTTFKIKPKTKVEYVGVKDYDEKSFHVWKSLKKEGLSVYCAEKDNDKDGKLYIQYVEDNGEIYPVNKIVSWIAGKYEIKNSTKEL